MEAKPNFSDLGQEWVSQTLVCLQQMALPLVNDSTCADILTDAFDSHVYCYTKVVPSVCAVIDPLRYTNLTFQQRCFTILKRFACNRRSAIDIRYHQNKI
jgi:hypothetical protein